MADVTGLEWVHGTEEPLEGESSVELHGWEDIALDQPKRFAADLGAMGVPREEVGAAVGVRDAAKAEMDAAVAGFWASHRLHYVETPPEVAAELLQVHAIARGGALEQLRDWFAGRHVAVEDRQECAVMLPLFVLSAPGTADSTAVFKTESAATRKAGWSISVAGTGVGGEATITTSVSSSFKAEAGQTKVVFLPLTVAVEKLRVSGAGGSATRIDVSTLKGQHPAPGLLLLDRGAVPPIGPLEQTYQLAGDPSGTPATYEYSYEQTRAPDVKLGVEAFGAKLGVEASATMKTTVTLTFELRGGVDYALHRLAEGDGLLWS